MIRTALRLNLMARLGASANTGLHTPRYRFWGPSFLIISRKMDSMDVVFPPDSCCRVFATYIVNTREAEKKRKKEKGKKYAGHTVSQ